ncbi:MAG: hypothetical protein ACI8RD_011706, partial [Bacillariaceae sp.]
KEQRNNSIQAATEKRPAIDLNRIFNTAKVHEDKLTTRSTTATEKRPAIDLITSSS